MISLISGPSHMVALLLALASAKRVGELQALSVSPD